MIAALRMSLKVNGEKKILSLFANLQAMHLVSFNMRDGRKYKTAVIGAHCLMGWPAG